MTNKDKDEIVGAVMILVGFVCLILAMVFLSELIVMVNQQIADINVSHFVGKVVVLAVIIGVTSVLTGLCWIIGIKIIVHKK